MVDEFKVENIDPGGQVEILHDMVQRVEEVPVRPTNMSSRLEAPDDFSGPKVGKHCVDGLKIISRGWDHLWVMLECWRIRGF